MKTRAANSHNRKILHGNSKTIRNKKIKVSDLSMNPFLYPINFFVLEFFSNSSENTLTIKNIEMHKTIAPKLNNPGQIRVVGSVDTTAIIIEISTVLSENISKIPPNIVGSLALAIAPSIVSNINEISIKMHATIINSNSNGKTELKNVKKAVNIPNIKPMMVS